MAFINKKKFIEECDNGNIPRMYGADFVCSINGENYLFSDGETYTIEEIYEH